jgi:hypothetical protein
MAMQGLKASFLGALLGLAAFIGSPSGAMAQSSNAAVMAAYGISNSTTLTPDQIATKLAAIMTQASGGGAAGVAAFVAALTATAGASVKPGDTTAANIMTALSNAAKSNPLLSGAIAGGIAAGSASLSKAGYVVPVSIANASASASATASTNNVAVVTTATVTVVQPSPAQTCSSGSCN